WPARDSCSVGTQYPTHMHLLACALALADMGLSLRDGQDPRNQKVESESFKRLERIADKMESWGLGREPGSSEEQEKHFGDKPAEIRDWFRERVSRILERNSYPLIGRLVGLKLLVDDHLMARARYASEKGSQHDSGFKTSVEGLEELLERLNEPPTHAGLPDLSKEEAKKVSESLEEFTKAYSPLEEPPEDAARVLENLQKKLQPYREDCSKKQRAGTQSRETCDLLKSSRKLLKELDREARERLRACQHLAELLQLEDLYDGRLHFTPLQTGSTLALWSLQKPESLRRIDSLVSQQLKLDRETHNSFERLLPRAPAVREMARRRLIEGQELYTMRSAYYRAIGRLFYLYDDFNDRRLHYNHALQMSAAELSNQLIEALEKRREDDAASGQARVGSATDC
ncbi:MAG: hypothetical protein AAF725_26595, partial [Acidobacteriota bacterium]